MGAFSLLVAGAGFEPASSGYEPDEIPLLYPAMDLLYSTDFWIMQQLIHLLSKKPFKNWIYSDILQSIRY